MTAKPLPEKTSVVGCIVLAAGRSLRFGADKRLARLPGGSTLLERTLASIPPDFTQRILVVHPGDEELVAPHQPAWKVVFAADAHLGMGHSLAAGIALATGWQGAVIALADMPFVKPATFNAIHSALTPARIVVPYWQQQRGNPVGIGADYFEELAELEGDQGARLLFRKHAAAVVRLEVEDAGIVQDIDTREGLPG